MHKLLQLNATANWGSTGKITEGIGQAAINRRWKSAIAYGRHANPSHSQLYRVGSTSNVYLHFAKFRLFDGEGLGSERPTRRLISFISEYNPNIIHLHNIHDHWLNYPILFEYLASVDIPIVWTFHDCWAFTGGCAHFENTGCFKWRNEECGCVCPQKRGYFSDKSHRNFLLRQDLLKPLINRLIIVGASNWITEYAKQSFLRNCRCTTIHNGIDLNIFKIKSTAKERMILGVSNIWPPYKGLGDFIALRKILPEDIKICLVGLTKRQIAALPKGIKGIERTKTVEELVELYNRASIFVNPTYNDTFPTVNLEALACGTPVITYRTGGSPEAIDTKTGIIVEKGDIRAMADTVVDVINNPQKFTSIVCRNHAVSNFNKDIQYDRYVNLYMDILLNGDQIATPPRNNYLIHNKLSLSFIFLRSLHNNERRLA